jgi:hypothetical protein
MQNSSDSRADPVSQHIGLLSCTTITVRGCSHLCAKMPFADNLTSNFTQVFARLDAWSVDQPPVQFVVAVTSSCCTAVVSAS